MQMHYTDKKQGVMGIALGDLVLGTDNDSVRHRKQIVSCSNLHLIFLLFSSLEKQLGSLVWEGLAKQLPREPKHSTAPSLITRDHKKQM